MSIELPLINMVLNRPFVHLSSCLLGDLALAGSKAGGDLAVIKTSLHLSCKCTYFTQQKQLGLYQSKVSSSLAAIPRPGH